MKELIKQLLRESLNIENELFSAYNGRYIFDVSKAYKLIKQNKIPFELKKYTPVFLNQFSHKEFSAVDPDKIERLKNQIDYTKPLGLLVNFINPETKKAEWILIDGNHRVRIAAESDMSGILYVIKDPNAVNQFLHVNTSIPHQLFPDDDDY